MRNKLFLLVITSLAIALSFSLALGSKQRSSTIQVMDRVFPEFTEYDLLLGDQTITRSDITKSKYQLINIWASWCGICKTEHPFLNQLKIEGIPIYGINYRDNKLSAIKVLENDGNPYLKIINDHTGDLSIDLGVIGTPETYLVDQEGQIIKKVLGVLEQKTWNDELANYFEN